MPSITKLKRELEKQKGRSSWRRGVIEYAWELFDNIEESTDVWEDDIPYHLLDRAMLNGADNWSEYSWGGCSLIYDVDIAKTLCAPYELKITDYGRKRPNQHEEWLDTQARALTQAATLIKE